MCWWGLKVLLHSAQNMTHPLKGTWVSRASSYVILSISSEQISQTDEKIINLTRLHLMVTLSTAEMAPQSDNLFLSY